MIKHTTLVWPGARAGAETSVYQLQHQLISGSGQKFRLLAASASALAPQHWIHACSFISVSANLKWIRGLYFDPETIFIPPLPKNDIFPPLATNWFFLYSYRALFASILPSFACILTIYFQFSLFLTSFLPFFYIFPIFFFTFSYFFLKMTSANIFLTPVGAGVFPIYRSLDWILKNLGFTHGSIRGSFIGLIHE
jgi:hypothetical protein